MCTMRGLSLGRPLAVKIDLTAVDDKAFAPNPYTVSVGNATNSPDFIELAAAFNDAWVIESKGIVDVVGSNIVI